MALALCIAIAAVGGAVTIPFTVESGYRSLAIGPGVVMGIGIFIAIVLYTILFRNPSARFELLFPGVLGFLPGWGLYALLRHIKDNSKDSKARRSKMFELSPTADTTSLTEMTDMDISPALLVQRFGWPAEGVSDKVSGRYIFVGQDGETFMVHDWKSTSLWDEELRTPKKFWAREKSELLQIRSREVDTEEFVIWLLEQVRGRPETWYEFLTRSD